MVISMDTDFLTTLAVVALIFFGWQFWQYRKSQIAYRRELEKTELARQEMFKRQDATHALDERKVVALERIANAVETRHAKQ